LTRFIVGGNPIFEYWRFIAYRWLVAGLTYVVLGYYFCNTNKKEMTGFLYGFGVFAILNAALVLGGWEPEQYIFWELIYPALVFGVIFLSIYLKSKSFLVFGAMYIMIYIIKITAEYFTDGLGWPLSLVLMGLALIAIGHVTYSLNRKYFSEAGV